MKQLITNTVESTVEVKGKQVKTIEYAFQIKGEEQEYSAEEVMFKPLLVRNKLMTWDSNVNSYTNETGLFAGITKDQTIPDKLGGNACGRVFPCWEGVKSFPPDRQAKEKAKAHWYTMLFGEVSFPGKAPMVVNFRLTGTQSMDWGNIEKQIQDTMSQTLIKLKAVGRPNKPQFATVEYTIVQKDLDDSGNEAAETEVVNFIKEENNKVLEAHRAAGGKY